MARVTASVMSRPSVLERALAADDARVLDEDFRQALRRLSASSGRTASGS